jgi:ABC-type transport system involved in cytochrome c biogenesis permease subunit
MLERSFASCTDTAFVTSSSAGSPLGFTTYRYQPQSTSTLRQPTIMRTSKRLAATFDDLAANQYSR